MHRTLLKIYQILLLLLFTGFVQAQIRLGYVEMRGTVVNMNNEPLYGASVMVLNSNKVKVTESNGSFFITVPRGTLTMVISYVGYETHYETIQPIDPRITREGLLEIMFRLKEKANILRPVEVFGKNVSQKPEVVYSMALNYVLDFDFLDEYLILLVRNDGNKYLQKKYLYYDSVVFEKQVESEFSSIFKDCLGNLHLLSQKKALQFFPLNDEFLFFNAYPIREFNGYVRNCVQYMNGNYVFINLTAYNQSAEYFSFLVDSMHYRYLVRIFDELAYLYIKDYAGQENMFTVRDNGFGIVQAPTVARDGFLKLLLRPVFGPLVRVNNRLFVFDPLKDSIYQYNDRSIPTRAIALRFHKQKYWSKWIETDVDHQKIYTRFDIRGQYYFSEVDPTTGELNHRYELYENHYPEKLKIKDGAAYYIKMVDKRRVLFRQPLHSVPMNAQKN